MVAVIMTPAPDLLIHIFHLCIVGLYEILLIAGNLSVDFF
jgi:hypothetical protein